MSSGPLPRRVKDQREATARERDERSQLAGLLSQILLDAIDNGTDPVVRARAEIGEQRLRACVEDPEALASPIDVQRRDAKHRRHAHLARFAPAVLAGLDPRAARGYEPLLEAIRYSAAHRDEPRLPDAPLTVLPAAWREWTLDEDGIPIRTRFELALWIGCATRSAAAACTEPAAHRYGDPADWMDLRE